MAHAAVPRDEDLLAVLTLELLDDDLEVAAYFAAEEMDQQQGESYQ